MDLNGFVGEQEAHELALKIALGVLGLRGIIAQFKAILSTFQP